MGIQVVGVANPCSKGAEVFRDREPGDLSLLAGERHLAASESLTGSATMLALLKAQMARNIGRLECRPYECTVCGKASAMLGTGSSEISAMEFWIRDPSNGSRTRHSVIPRFLFAFLLLRIDLRHQLRAVYPFSSTISANLCCHLR